MQTAFNSDHERMVPVRKGRFVFVKYCIDSKLNIALQIFKTPMLSKQWPYYKAVWMMYFMILNKAFLSGNDMTVIRVVNNTTLLNSILESDYWNW